MLDFFYVFSFLYRTKDVPALQIKINPMTDLSLSSENIAQSIPSSFDEASEGFHFRIFIMAIPHYLHLICLSFF